MVTYESSSVIGDSTTVDVPSSAPELDPFDCWWDQDLRRAGVEPEPSAAINTGVPALALTMLGAVALTAFLAPDPGSAVAPFGIVLLLAACVPWTLWLVRGDDGPTWRFMVLALAPVAALGVGHWFVDAMSLGSDMAYALLAFPGLFLVVLGLSVAPVRMAAGYGIAAYAAYGAPLLAAWASGRGVDGAEVMTWHVGFALSVVAGYAVRFSYNANAEVTAAREALAWQAAADERRQVARDVHDVVAHTLAVTMLHITAARMAVLRSAPDEATAALEEAERQGRASLADIRRIVRLLRADDASTLGAQPGMADVQALVDGYRAAGLPVEMSISVDTHHASPTAELAVYRVLQEALTNAARHGAGPATVHLEANDRAITLRVDNPVTQQAAKRSRGSGLIGMRERIASAGGTIETGPQADRWVVRAVVPGEVAA